MGSTNAQCTKQRESEDEARAARLPQRDPRPSETKSFGLEAHGEVAMTLWDGVEGAARCDRRPQRVHGSARRRGDRKVAVRGLGGGKPDPAS
ncbi:hypothetical protein AAFF_G00434110 [Aldrovandia affinis]|uniref:Uncharacterized protein n=1 Tax=Aldrovandia affinis TaxID=143900 RepID=A0AAD7WI20_9TELE|nr:hypothetical protein AAFF_G00434110 [Aldrovandia affinis]